MTPGPTQRRVRLLTDDVRRRTNTRRAQEMIKKAGAQGMTAAACASLFTVRSPPGRAQRALRRQSGSRSQDLQKVTALTLHVRPAVSGDMPAILGFIDEASRWLPMKNTDQWSRPWPDRERRDHRIRRGLEAGRTWLVEADGTAAATVSCRPDANPELWTAAERQIPAVYVSRLIVARSHAGQDIGRELLDWAGCWAAAQYQAQLIRIDVWTTNAALQNYYEKRGFCRVRYAEDVAYPSAALLQKATADITAADFPRLREIPRLLQPAGQPRQSSLIGPATRRRPERITSLATGEGVSRFTRLTRPTLFRNRFSHRTDGWRQG